ncbi:unnamed protein product [Urochloa humidicola]
MALIEQQEADHQDAGGGGPGGVGSGDAVVNHVRSGGVVAVAGGHPVRDGERQLAAGGVRSLNSGDRQAACRCLKSLATSLKKLNMGTVKCGVSVPFPISMSTDDCNKVS